MNFFNPLKDLFTGDLREFFKDSSSFGRRLYKYDGATEMIRTMLWIVWKNSSYGNRKIDTSIIDNEVREFLGEKLFRCEVDQAGANELPKFYEHVADFIRKANKELYSGITGFFLRPLKKLRNYKQLLNEKKTIQAKNLIT